MMWQISKGTWQGFRKNSSEEKDLMFRVERTTNTLTRLEFQVFLTNGYGGEMLDFKSSHFWIARGPPGSGKGTKSPIIKDEYCLCHLATGDMLRADVVGKTPLGIKAKEAMDNVCICCMHANDL
ncbi:hypothetical protein L6452_00685 [Arctium lappa]|uniref:Uncharacterized protein n=1 Tax=Arctium lappa TaxID=4217 RepID=A0ACB9FFE4_ARCLA|nr:hypothetical protein L6452_00685 [Arctium lappa]